MVIFPQGKGKVVTYWLKGENPDNVYLGDDCLSPQNGMVPQRPSTPRPRSTYQDPQHPHTKLVDLRRVIDEVGFVNETSRPAIMNHKDHERDQQVPENPNISTKNRRDETEVPLLSITEPSPFGVNA